MSLGYTGVLNRLRSEVGDLLERHERARDLSEFARYADNPVGFIRDVLGDEPWSRQVEVAEAVRDHPLVVVRSANGVGKDWLGARLALHHAIARRGLVLCVSATERQVRHVMFGEIARAFSRCADLPGELFAQGLRLGPDEPGGIVGLTSNAVSKLSGFHAPRVMAVLSEAQGIEEFAWEGVLSCVVGESDCVAAFGNPLAPAGRFWSASQPGSGWKSIRISAAEHPNIVEGREVIPGGPSLAFVERIAREYGRPSGVFRARVEGEFPDEAEEGLVRRSWLEAAFERYEEGAEDGTPTIASLDVARFGADHSCLAVRHGERGEPFVLWHGADITETVDRVESELAARGLESGGVSLVVDEVGLGSGAVDDLRARGWTDVVGFNGGKRARNAEKYHNRRSEALWRVARRLEAGTLALPRDEEFAREMLAHTWNPTPEGRIAVAPKDTVRAALGGASPDRVDALAMGVWCEKRVSPPVAAIPIVRVCPWDI